MLTVERSKRRVEAITIAADFSDRMAADDTIFAATVTIEVFSGEDASPSSMLYLPTIIDAQSVAQRVKEGVVGVVYDVQFSVLTNAGLTLEQTTRLAVLPDSKGATPSYMPLYFTSEPYPIDSVDSLRGAITLDMMRLELQPYNIDSARGTIALESIALYGSGTTYTIPAEGTRGTIALDSINLFGSSVEYLIPFESITAGITLESLAIYTSGVAYDIPFESTRGTITLDSMSLI